MTKRPQPDPIGAADLLEKAADLIETFGHVRGIPWNKDGYCVYGAIQFCSENKPGEGLFRHHRLAVGAMDAMSELIHSRGHAVTLTHWNDTIAENGAEVVDFMRHAAKELRNA